MISLQGFSQTNTTQTDPGNTENSEVILTGRWFNRRGPCVKAGDMWIITIEKGFYIDSVISGNVKKSEVIVSQAIYTTRGLAEESELVRGRRYLVVMTLPKRIQELLQSDESGYYQGKFPVPASDLKEIIPVN